MRWGNTFSRLLDSCYFFNEIHMGRAMMLFDPHIRKMLACLLPHHVPLKTHTQRVDLELPPEPYTCVFFCMYFYLQHDWTEAEVPRALCQLQSD